MFYCAEISWKLLVLFSVILNKYGICDDVLIGGLFDDENNFSKTFEFALEDINKKAIYAVTLSPMIKATPLDEPYETSEAVCQILGAGALGIFGPFTAENVDAVQSICDIKEMPQILTRRPNYNLLRGNSILNLFPDPETLAHAYIDIIQAWKWEKFVILYEDDSSFLTMSTLLYLATNLKMHAIMRQLDEENSGTYRTKLRTIRDSDIRNIVLDCQYENLEEILHQAQQIGMMSAEYKFFITNFDLHTISLTDYQFSSVQILGVRIVSPESPLVQDVSTAYLGTGDPIKDLLDPPSWKLRSDEALIIDAVSMFVSTLNELDLETYVLTQDLACNSSDSWKDGLTILNLMKTTTHNGLTGEIKFDTDGIRSEFQLEVIELKQGGVIRIGQWNSSASPKLEITQPSQSQIFNDEESLRNRTFRVEICLTEPYAMWRESPKNLQGNDRFEGYAIDLIQKLSEIEGFKYEFIVRLDNDNGGMIKDVMSNVSDLAIADLTITSEREELVDFTDAFMNLGISILFEKAKKAPPSFFSFAEPFSYDTWGTLVLSVVVVGISYYLIARVSPDEWTNPDPCKENPEFLTNQFNMKNSFWFTVASLVQQGTEIAPIGIATRTLTGAWWFFILIIVASYTANLTAFLSTEKPEYLFKTLEELVNKAEELEIRYGAKRGGATYKFFNSSANPIYDKVFKHMSSHPEDMMAENKLGVEEAKKGKYAFFMESTSIEYATQRNCELEKVGETMDPNKGYAIAMRKYSSYRKRLNLAILSLQSQGILDILKTKWWEERRGGGACNDDEASQPEATPLYISNVEGVFHVTVYGMIFAIVFAFFEWFTTIFKLAKNKRLPISQAFMTELKFFLSFDQLVKPLKATSSTKSEISDTSSVRYKLQFRSRSRRRFSSMVVRSRSRSRSRSKTRSRSHSYASSKGTSSSRRTASSKRTKSSSGSVRRSQPQEMRVFYSRSPSIYRTCRGISQEKLTENMDE